jgi:hypothetical protein
MTECQLADISRDLHFSMGLQVPPRAIECLIRQAILVILELLVLSLSFLLPAIVY